MSHDNPEKWVGTMARVRGVIVARTASACMLRVCRSQSTKTVVAPRLTIMLPTEKKVMADVITSSPRPIAHTSSATSRAAVADVKERTARPPW